MRKSTWVMIVVSAIAIILTTSSVITMFLLLQKVNENAANAQPKEYLPQQTVLSRVKGVDGPAVKMTDMLVVSARKCNLTKKPLTIKGEGSFTAVQPPGLSVLIGSGVVTRKPGCTTIVYRFSLPQTVKDRVNELNAVHKQQVWQIFGEDTPLNGGATVSWSTQPFVIIP